MKKYIIAHDLGTSGDKATLFTEEGQLVASRTSTYEVHFFGQNRAEQDPEDWWKAVCNTTQELLEYVSAEEIEAVSFSAQMQGCLVVDVQGKPLRNSIIWADQRAEKEADILKEQIGAANIYEITGHRVSPSYSIEKLMWIKENEPNIYEKTYKMLQAKDYIIYKLTGVFLTDYSDASGTNAMDLKNLCWSQQILQAAGIDEDKLPDMKYSTDIAGRVTEAAAKECGLLAGTRIVCGGGDGPCSAVGAGCVEDDEWFTTFGTSAWIGGTTKKPTGDEEQIVFCFAHVIPNRYMPCGAMQAAGSSYSYIRKTLCDGESYETLNRMMEEAAPGSNDLFFLPYLLGERSPRWNPNTSGAFIGIKPKHEKKEYLRATIEGVAYNLELILQAHRKKNNIDHMILTGGGAKGEIIAHILSDIMNVTLSRPDHVEEATSIGAALVAGVGVGIFKDFSEVKKFLKFKEEIYPQISNIEIYQRKKVVFDHIYQALCPIYEEMK